MTPHCILVTGAQGQVGYELMRQAPRSMQVIGLGSDELDIRNAAAVEQCIAQLQPDVIINAAAYTAVDKAEGEPEKAYAVNGEGVANIARSAERHGACVLHISTDYVFAGDGKRPYREEDPVAPINVYGASKLAGEQALREHCAKGIILRTSWVFGSHGNNFVKTMLRLGFEREEISVVTDQLGSPTSARSIAQVLWSLTGRYLELNDLPWGIYHFTGLPACSWHQFAEVIFQNATALGLLPRAPRVNPITTAEYPTPAKRPHYSVMDNQLICQKLGVPQINWHAELDQCLRQLLESPDSA